MISFRDLTRADLPHVIRWQRSEAARPWFRSPLTLDEARERYDERIDGTSPVRMFVAVLGDRPIGYAQLYAVDAPPIAPGHEVPRRAIGIDFVVGEDDLIGRGIGTALIGDFIRDVVLVRHPDATHVVAQPNHRNRRSIRALEKNGFIAGLWVDAPARPGEKPETEIVCTLDLRPDYAGAVSETTGSSETSERGHRSDASEAHDTSETGEIRVAVIGAAGRMGAEVCRAIEAAAGLHLSGQFDAEDDLGDLAGAQVVVEFSIPDASAGNVAHCIERGIHVVVGTTGWDEAKLETLRGQLADAPPSRTGSPVGVLIAPNFAIGAILMMSFAAAAARFYESVEVIELHHPDKVDAPSGTAARTAALIAASRAEAGLGDVPDATTHDPDGARGSKVSGIPVHSVRLRGLVAHQEVLLGNVGEMLTIRHDSFDRVSFMPGVLEGVRRVADHPGLTVGLEHYLGLDR